MAPEECRLPQIASSVTLIRLRSLLAQNARACLLSSALEHLSSPWLGGNLLCSWWGRWGAAQQGEVTLSASQCDGRAKRAQRAGEVLGVGRSSRWQRGRQERGTMQAQCQGWTSELFLSFPARARRCSSSSTSVQWGRETGRPSWVTVSHVSGEHRTGSRG